MTQHAHQRAVARKLFSFGLGDVTGKRQLIFHMLCKFPKLRSPESLPIMKSTPTLSDTLVLAAPVPGSHDSAADRPRHHDSSTLVP